MLMWLLGSARQCRVHLSEPRRMAGSIDLERARVRWFLSVEPSDLPWRVQPGAKTTFRSITVDGRELEFTDGFADLHTRVYEDILAGRGFGIDDARPSIALVHDIRTAAVSAPDENAHPLALGGGAVGVA